MLGHGRLSPPCSSLWWRCSIAAGLRMPRIAQPPLRIVRPQPPDRNLRAMNAGTWAAIAAVLIALVALFYSRRSTDAADRSASAADRSAAAAEEQTKIQRQLRIDSAQPYVWADVRPDDESGFILTLIIGNSGPTIATNVRAKIDPPLPTIEQLKESTVAQARLAEGISSLPPGRILVWELGQGFNLLQEDGPQEHTLTITADR